MRSVLSSIPILFSYRYSFSQDLGGEIGAAFLEFLMGLEVGRWGWYAPAGVGGSVSAFKGRRVWDSISSC